MTKVFFVDFDDTLCIHTEYLNGMFVDMLFADPELACQTIYKHSLPNHLLIDYLQKQKSPETTIVLLSAANSKLLAVKEVWCEHNCQGIIDEFISSSYEMTKPQIIQAYCRYHQLELSEALLIDDAWSERKESYAIGLPCVTPQEVMLQQKVR